MIYGVYASSAMVNWPPAKIFQDEIRVRVARYIYHLRASMIKHIHSPVFNTYELLDYWFSGTKSCLPSSPCLP